MHWQLLLRPIKAKIPTVHLNLIRKLLSCGGRIRLPLLALLASGALALAQPTAG
jgi:hypothetical protein